MARGQVLFEVRAQASPQRGVSLRGFLCFALRVPGSLGRDRFILKGSWQLMRTRWKHVVSLTLFFGQVMYILLYTPTTLCCRIGHRPLQPVIRSVK